MDWEEFDRETRTLAGTIRETPDIVAGIARGGVIPATLLSKLLNVKDMFVLNMQRVGETRRISAYALPDISVKNILLVEDMIETGRSLIAGKKYLEENGALVKTACLYTMPVSEIKPDYSLRKIAEVTSFPWNRS